MDNLSIMKGNRQIIRTKTVMKCSPFVRQWGIIKIYRKSCLARLYFCPKSAFERAFLFHHRTNTYDYGNSGTNPSARIPPKTGIHAL